MSIFFRLFLLFFITLMSFFVSSYSVAQDNIIYDVRLGLHDGKTRLVIEGVLTQKPAVNLGQNTLIQAQPFLYQGGGVTTKPAHKVNRLTIDGNTGRVALDFTGMAILQSNFVLPSNTRSNANRYVYDFAIDGKKASPVQSSDIALQPVTAPLPAPIKPTKPFQVVLDAGHGGKDPGAVAPNGTLEKDVTLAMALRLRNILSNRGYSVHLTRETDIFIPLRGRVNIARDKDADLFISIHADSLPQSRRKTRGASVYTLSNTSSDKETEALARRENRADIIGGIDLSYEEADVANILIDLAMRDTMNQSKKLANSVVLSFANSNIKMLNPPHRFAGFAVLKAVDVPSILLEIGFLSNQDEARALVTRSHQERLANTIADAIDDYKNRHHPHI